MPVIPLLGKPTAEQILLSTTDWVPLNKLVLNLEISKCVLLSSGNVLANATELNFPVDGKIC